MEIRKVQIGRSSFVVTLPRAGSRQKVKERPAGAGGAMDGLSW
jgi:hypothetical protein